jgi:hypothetical protein
MLRKFDKVFVVAVTECYGTTVQEALTRIDGVCSERPDVLIHMHNRSYNLDGYRILGTTLWSDREEDESRDIAKFIADFDVSTISPRPRTDAITKRFTLADRRTRTMYARP